MNFYQHFLGDYQRDTAHLSLIEHGAYRVLLDAYYGTERALPADMPGLYRIAKAMTPVERRAVEMVAKHFFPVGEDGLRHNKRADAEIAGVNAYAGAQSKRAHMRWHKQRQMQAQCPTDANQTPDSKQKKEQADPPDGGTSSELWNFGVTLLAECGLKEGTARSFLGSLLRDYEPIHVETALRSAAGKADPKGYVLGVLREKPKRGHGKRVSI